MSETTLSNANQRRSFSVMIGFVLSAWGILAIWSLSRYAVLLDHHTIGEGDLPLAARLAIFIIGWALMILAMMLPRSFLMVSWAFPKKPQPARRDPLPCPYLLGYLVVWIAFGGFIFLGDAVLHEWVEHSPVLNNLSAGIIWVLLLIVGGYQFTTAKRACLLKDHSPIFTHDEAHSYPPERFFGVRMGLRHGFYCLGSCWGLMLLMFAVGSMNFLIMLGLTGIMSAERIIPARLQFSRLVGVCLILLAFINITKTLYISGA